MQQRLPLDPSPFGPEAWSRRPDERAVTARDVLVGALIGLAAGLLLNYLVLFGSRFVGLPASGEPFGDGWFAPVLLATTVLGIVYYGRDE